MNEQVRAMESTVIEHAEERVHRAGRFAWPDGNLYRFPDGDHVPPPLGLVAAGDDWRRPDASKCQPWFSLSEEQRSIVCVLLARHERGTKHRFLTGKSSRNGWKHPKRTARLGIVLAAAYADAALRWLQQRAKRQASDAVQDNVPDTVQDADAVARADTLDGDPIAEMVSLS